MRTSFSYVLISSDTFCLTNGTGDYRIHKKCPFSFLVSKSLLSRTFELYDVSYSFLVIICKIGHFTQTELSQLNLT